MKPKNFAVQRSFYTGPSKSRLPEDPLDHVPVHVGQAAVALARLAQDPDLRRRMGRAGQERVYRELGHCLQDNRLFLA
mgnify:CR=1 FL=1